MNMDQEEDELTCHLELLSGAVLSEQKYEPMLEQLFSQVSAGEWMSLEDALPTDFHEDIFVAWLNLPDQTERAFRLVLFFHEDSGWSMTANYNAERLLRPSR